MGLVHGEESTEGEVEGEDGYVLVHGEDGLRMVSHEHRNCED